MEKKIEIDNIPKELKGREKIYYDTLKTYKFPRLRIASLKYAVYSFEILEVFKEKISAIRKDITGLKTGINKYKGNKIFFFLIQKFFYERFYNFFACFHIYFFSNFIIVIKYSF